MINWISGFQQLLLPHLMTIQLVFFSKSSIRSVQKYCIHLEEERHLALNSRSHNGELSLSGRLITAIRWTAVSHRSLHIFNWCRMNFAILNALLISWSTPRFHWLNCYYFFDNYLRLLSFPPFWTKFSAAAFLSSRWECIDGSFQWSFYLFSFQFHSILFFSFSQNGECNAM